MLYDLIWEKLVCGQWDLVVFKNSQSLWIDQKITNHYRMQREKCGLRWRRRQSRLKIDPYTLRLDKISPYKPWQRMQGVVQGEIRVVNRTFDRGYHREDDYCTLSNNIFGGYLLRLFCKALTKVLIMSTPGSVTLSEQKSNHKG